jgi:LCP family protein required for cell wall assembly
MISTMRGAERGAPAPRPSSISRARRRRRRAVLVALALLFLLVAGDAALLSGRVSELDVDLRRSAARGDTWVLVGLDSRGTLPSDAAAQFGTAAEVPGSRADVVLVVRDDGVETTVLSVPRDVVVTTADGPGRLALTWNDGPRETVDALCGLGIPVDHLVAVDLAGFQDVVDAVGGLDIDMPQPIRDPGAGLLLTRPGRRHVDGATALALVRSRHPENLVDGAWVPTPVDPDGRAESAGTVLGALVEQARSSWTRPWRLQSLAWAASGALAVDAGTSTAELGALLRADLDAVRVLPVGDPVGGSLARFPTAATAAALADAGLSCTP